MKTILRMYNTEKTYMFPTGALATPQVIAEKYPATFVIPHAIITDSTEQSLMGWYPVHQLVDLYKIDTTDKTIEQIIQEAEDKMEATRLEDEAKMQEPTAEERIAAQMEYQTMMSL